MRDIFDKIDGSVRPDYDQIGRSLEVYRRSMMSHVQIETLLARCRHLESQIEDLKLQARADASANERELEEIQGW